MTIPLTIDVDKFNVDQVGAMLESDKAPMGLVVLLQDRLELLRTRAEG